MKTTANILLALGIVLSACNANKQLAKANNDDDIYYSSKDAPAKPKRQEYNPDPNAGAVNNQGSATKADDYTPANNTQQDNSANRNSGDTYVTNNNTYTSSYSDDDYYDYAYAARIRRFNSPYYNTWSYYDPYYTNMYYYNYNPYYFGTSIYSTYSWWAPTVTVGWG